MTGGGITKKGFLYRWLAALLLVGLTWNPTPVNFVSWWAENDGFHGVKLLIAVVFLLGYAIFLRATFNSIGWYGVLALVAFCIGLIWVLADYAAWVFSIPTFTPWFVIVCIASIMNIGLSWSFVRRFLTGQFDAS